MKKKLLLPLKILLLLWTIEVIDQFTPLTLDQYGIRPRTLEGLAGILFAPFLHGNWSHLIGNSSAFLMLSFLMLLSSTTEFFKVTLWVGLLAGLGTWIFGAPNSIHIGASGVIYGYLGFLLLRGFAERKILSIFVSLFVAVIFSYAIVNLLAFEAGVSWSGHLFGFLSGAWVGWKRKVFLS